MARIVMENIAHRYRGAAEYDYALQPLQLEWRDGGAYALLGPSGCGKTTLLNIISGLLTPSSGRIFFDNKDVTDLPPQLRNIAQVFQFPVVYDSMTVAENLEFPLRNRGVPKTTRRERVAAVLELLELTAVANRQARNLSADGRQKISLGRGLVRSDANAILFDEPLTVIDPALKWELRAQLKRVHQQVGHTMIYVTHDQTEALTFAEKVVVMLEGKILQIGTPEALFLRPEHTFVGRFIGSPGMNILPCELTGSSAIVAGQTVPLQRHYPALKGPLELGIRPEHVTLVDATTTQQRHRVSICKVDDLGREKIIHLQMGELELATILQEGKPIPENPGIQFPPRHVHLYQNAALVENICAGRD